MVNPTPAAIYTGIGNAITTISRVEGYLSLWRGLSSVIVGAGTSTSRNGALQRSKWLISETGPAHAVYFATYEAVKQSMGGNAAGHHPLAAGEQLEDTMVRIYIPNPSQPPAARARQ